MTPAALQQKGGNIAAQDTAEAGNHVDHHDGETAFGQTQMEGSLEIAGKPEQIEPPDGIGEKLGDGKGPGFFAGEQACPGDVDRLLNRVALDEG